MTTNLLDLVVEVLNQPKIRDAINKEIAKKITSYDENIKATTKKQLIGITAFNREGSAIEVEGIIA